MFNQVRSNKISCPNDCRCASISAVAWEAPPISFATKPPYSANLPMHCSPQPKFRWMLEKCNTKKLKRPKSVLICYDIFRFLLLFFLKSSKFEFTSQNTQKHKQYLLTFPQKNQKKTLRNILSYPIPPKKIFSRSSGFEKSLKFLFETLYQTRILSPPNDMDVA